MPFTILITVKSLTASIREFFGGRFLCVRFSNAYGNNHKLFFGAPLNHLNEMLTTLYSKCLHCKCLRISRTVRHESQQNIPLGGGSSTLTDQDPGSRIH